jgi:hypothetical protein
MHSPQWVHQWSWITAFFFTSLTASTGQSRTQNPQPMHLSVLIIIAIVISFSISNKSKQKSLELEERGALGAFHLRSAALKAKNELFYS